MSRKVFDKLASGVGIVIVMVLLVAGGLMAWGHSFTQSSVRDQLAMQQIYFPTRQALAHPDGTEITASMQRYLGPYAGQQLLTGRQAETYANHFIAVHLSKMPYNGVYSKISTAAAANPDNAQLQALKTTSFMGTTLRGMLLTAYAFGTIGTILLWGMIAAFIAAAAIALMVGLGFWHAARTPSGKRILEGHPYAHANGHQRPGAANGDQARVPLER